MYLGSIGCVYVVYGVVVVEVGGVEGKVVEC